MGFAAMEEDIMGWLDGFEENALPLIEEEEVVIASPQFPVLQERGPISKFLNAVWHKDLKNIGRVGIFMDDKLQVSEGALIMTCRKEFGIAQFSHISHNGEPLSILEYHEALQIETLLGTGVGDADTRSLKLALLAATPDTKQNERLRRVLSSELKQGE